MYLCLHGFSSNELRVTYLKAHLKLDSFSVNISRYSAYMIRVK